MVMGGWVGEKEIQNTHKIRGEACVGKVKETGTRKTQLRWNLAKRRQRGGKNKPVKTRY